MSLVQELGDRVRAATDELPTALVAVAVQRLQAATDLLASTRSASPPGLPQLATATEHAEHAGRALWTAGEALTDYLIGIGLGVSAPREAVMQRGREPDREFFPPPAPDPGPSPVPGWWPARVATLTGHDGPAADEGRPTAERPAGPADPHSAASDTGQLLRRVAAGVRAGARDRLHRDLAAAAPPVGLGLAVLTPPLLHQLAADLLGHPPRAGDVKPLTSRTAGRVRALLPGLPPHVLDAVLTRVCRVARSGERPERIHPADWAIAGAVLAGVLLHLLGRDTADLVEHPITDPATHRRSDA